MSYEPIVVRRATARLRARREEAERTRYALERRLYREQPELAQLDAQLRGNMAQLAELALSGEPDREARLAQIRARGEELMAQRRALLAAAGCAPQALDGAPQCPHCRDTGWVGSRMCGCLKQLCAQEQLRRLSSLLELGDQCFEKARLDIYSPHSWQGEARSPRENMANILKLCRGYADRFPEYPLKNLLFSGGTGLGKTFLSACIARAVSEGGHSVVYDTAINVFSRFEERKFARGEDRGREARDDTRRYLNCDLLILDDLGSELTTDMVRASLYELVNGRLGPRWRTIISTNLPAEELRSRYTPQIASRLEGEYRELTFYGDDLRLRER